MSTPVRLTLIISLALNLLFAGLAVTQVLAPKRRPNIFGGIFFTSEAVFEKLPASTRTRLNQELADDRAAMAKSLDQARAARAHALDMVTGPTYSASEVEAALATYRQDLDVVMVEAHTAFVQTMAELDAKDRATVVSAIREQLTANRKRIAALCARNTAPKPPPEPANH